MTEQESTSFGAMLRHWRLVSGLTQEVLAERSGLGIRSIQGLERGETQPRRETLRRLTEALQLSDEQVVPFARVGQPGPRKRHLASPASEASNGARGPRAASLHNLPVQLTTFIGREHQLVELTERLHSTHLLTLTGTGGCGKTRLALQMAAGKVDDYADGVWLAELAGLADPELVAQTVATATGVRESAGQPIRATLLAALRSYRMLVVLNRWIETELLDVLGETGVGCIARRMTVTWPKPEVARTWASGSV